MELREIVGAECEVRTRRPAAVRQPSGRIPSPWLACYPTFEDALRGGETTFSALPHHAMLVALKQTTVEMAERAIASKALDDVSVSFVELATDCVSDIVEHYLSQQEVGEKTSDRGLTASLEGLSGQLPAMTWPLNARPPCLVRPGHHVFSDGWMRYFLYCSRGDLTIPLLAIDWLDFHHRLSTYS